LIKNVAYVLGNLDLEEEKIYLEDIMNTIVRESSSSTGILNQ
jgi:hypothetical protein